MTPKQRAEELCADYREEILSGNSPDMVKMLTAAIDSFKVEQAKPPVCLTHKKYKGKRQPKNNCTSCWRLYLYEDSRR